ncbi:MAG: undecaprenyl-diphosphate phosphatase [Gammaproteobacteria bacterium]|nr:undecaprenyl-diphosphate phosphatase [Gammaproteobacteria bacterium]MDP2140942.1 undecaprenyl-diphosphate phosphatase [Gammaproteobacteria bacterium]MDP2349314.1 undecaprenyl-diphosphate phosphatase [Gammaproteobacteria bacterium]
MDVFKITVLAILQGLTEFLPISSSAHIILPKELLGWPDQGLVFDVAVHVGSLIAVVSYFRRDIRSLFGAWVRSCTTGMTDDQARLAWYLLIATIPAGVVGFFFAGVVETYSRSMLLIAFTSIFFSILLYFADRFEGSRRPLEKMDLKSCLIIGFSQILALIPGTSRSGITMTAGLFCGFDRRAAAKFSFLLAIPIIASGGIFKGAEMLDAGTSTDWRVLAYAILVSAAVSFSCIHYFLRLIERIGFMPFIIYRIVMGFALLGIHFSGVL